MDAFIGDRFVIRINGKYWSPDVGTKYFIKDLPNVILTEADIKKLEKYKDSQKYKEPSCRECAYSDIDGSHYPCSVCYRGDPKEEMFTPK